MKKGVAILMYHALAKPGIYDIDKMKPADRSYALPEELFESHLQKFAEGKAMLSVPATFEAEGSTLGIANAALSAYDGSFMLTFDDSWGSHLSVALPLLEKYNCKAVFFISVNQIGKNGMLNKCQIRKLYEQGAVIGSHGMNHRYFNDLDSYQLRYELSESRKILSDITGCDIYNLALPGGRAHSELKTISAEEGYTHVFGSCPGIWKGCEAIIPRLAMTAAVSADIINIIITDPGNYIFIKKIRYQSLKLLRMLIGNKKYDRLRGLVKKEDNGK